MRFFLPLCLVCLLVNPVMAGWFGPGPFNNGAPFAGYLNGRYMGVVTGSNISGVLGFAIVDGAPPFRQAGGAGGQQQQQQQQQQGGEAGQFQERQSAAIRPDVLQNYFAIFVEGRVYSGITFAGIDIDSNTVSGALQGENPAPLHNFTAQPGPFTQGSLIVATNTNTGVPVIVGTNPVPLVNLNADALPIVNRGLSGGFTATINSKKATFTYAGSGQLSTPANSQQVVMTVTARTNPNVAGVSITNTNIDGSLTVLTNQPFLPPGFLYTETAGGRVITLSTPFNIRGIRTSFAAVNQAAILDQQQQQQGQQ